MANGWAEEQLIISRRRRRGWTFECHNFYILAPKVDCRWLAKQDWWLSEASRVLIIFCEIPNKHFFDNKNQTTTTTTSTTTTTCDDLYRDSPHRKVKKDFKPKRDFVHKTYSLSLSLSLSSSLRVFVEQGKLRFCTILWAYSQWRPSKNVFRSLSLDLTLSLFLAYFLCLCSLSLSRHTFAFTAGLCIASANLKCSNFLSQFLNISFVQAFTSFHLFSLSFLAILIIFLHSIFLPFLPT